jgi:hypothetical protein
MEILQQDLVDPDLSNSDVKSLREQGQKQPWLLYAKTLSINAFCCQDDIHIYKK